MSAECLPIYFVILVMSIEIPDQGKDAEEEPIDPAVTLELFRKWRSPRHGRSNPERLNNPVWEWLIRSKVSAYSAAKKFGEPSALHAGPGWCFDRFGQSSTSLPDGRTILIAGEHEDSYDPDFYIYNDVVVLHPNGKIDILGYPAEIFPPTDFHTATLVGNRIIIIGCLGHPEQRKPGTTPIFIFDIDALGISTAHAIGTPPGWIHDHTATLEEGETSILVRNGKLDRGEKDASLVENIDDWRLHLTDWHWERITDKRWQRWEIGRKDGKPNHLWYIRQARWFREVNWEKEIQEEMDALAKELGDPPNLDLLSMLYRPAIPHEQMPQVEEEYNVFRIKVDGVVVRYVEDSHSIQMTVEGELPQTTVKSLAANLCEKVALLENAAIDMKQL